MNHFLNSKRVESFFHKQKYIAQTFQNWATRGQTFPSSRTFPYRLIFFNPIQNGLFQSCLQTGGGGKRPPPPYLKSFAHILQWSNLSQLYLTWKRSKKCMNHVTHPLSSVYIGILSPEISKFCYIKKYRYILWYIISNSFNFSRVFKDCFNKHGYNFDDVSKNDYLSPS